MASEQAGADTGDTATADLVADVSAQLFDRCDPHELADYTRRFTALAHPLRFAILYRLRDLEELTASELTELTGRSGNALHSHLDKLVEANLMTNWKQTDPDKHQPYSYYAISGLGAHFIDLAVDAITQESDAFEEFE